MHEIVWSDSECSLRFEWDVWLQCLEPLFYEHIIERIVINWWNRLEKLGAKGVFKEIPKTQRWVLGRLW
jgi:hypothetical protein